MSAPSRRPARLAATLAAALLLGCGGGSSEPGATAAAVRPPNPTAAETQTMNSISLQFAEYRGDPGELAARVDRYLAQAQRSPLDKDPAALVVPHAGYVYSGPVAAHAYAAVKGKAYDTVVVVGPSHRAAFRGISVMDAASFDTPLGRLAMDRAMIGELLAAGREISYLPEAHGQEHSLEVQLPFLQRSLGGFSLVMAVMGGWSPEAEEAFLGVLTGAMKSKKVLLVASSDLSHYHDYDSARRLDARALKLVAGLDASGLLEATRKGECELCGLLPVHLAMALASRTGHTEVLELKAASSGDTAGPRDQVVGYASVAFLPAGKPAAVEGELPREQKKRLLEIARRTITDYVGRGALPEIEESSPGLLVPCGAFVTIKRNGQLRGCIGNFVSREPLYRTVMNMAVAASTQDPRFPPMTAAETGDMRLEISVLTPMRRVADPREIEVGKHGLYIVKGHYAGTLLPQVATEYGWDRTTFLEQTCRKAGLPTGAWKEGAEIYVYGAQVFGED